MNYTITARLALAGAALISLQACSSEPTGQVVAVVNGEEITQQELNAEIAELPAPPVGDKEAIRRQILQQIIDRRLMAQVAKEDGLDRDPMYIIRERRLKEELLVQMYGVKTADTVRVPDAASVKKYLAENPGKFSQRTAYLVDQISFDFPSDQKILKALEADKSLADVEETLKSFKIDYSKGANSMDSGNIPTPVLNQILALPAGEPFIIPMQRHYRPPARSDHGAASQPDGGADDASRKHRQGSTNAARRGQGKGEHLVSRWLGSVAEKDSGKIAGSGASRATTEVRLWPA